ncbi:chorismate mutase 1, chloroplastic-like isoform X2 [Cornus florida]|uniref:chorismate mutase 1, chloroplastic-like isoform X2 n=1 Tax=Cornus florida TaxID=4283 RepID=UPI00289D5592|nr:chorismate mutase 1, chloroplastic-like isoform X2 [Cornus florida]
MEAKLLRVASPAMQTPTGFKFSKPSCLFGYQNIRICSFRFLNPGLSTQGIRSAQGSASSFGLPKKESVDESESCTLESIRQSLIRQEDSIIFSLLERAQYCLNVEAYDPNAFFMEGFNDSLVEFMVKETEKLHAQVLHPIAADSINFNNTIWNMYFRDIIPRLVEDGDDGNSGSAAVCDTICLQALSKRIHYGKFVAEAKFRASPTEYEAAIRAQDICQLVDLLTHRALEKTDRKRVMRKAKIFGREVPVNVEEDRAHPVFRIDPCLVADLYVKWIMPLTKEVELEYLLRRLD